MFVCLFFFFVLRDVNMEEIRSKVNTSSPSVALIRLLREITSLGKALDKVT